MPTEATKNYPAWFTSLLQDVLDMRDAQKDYFASRNEYKKRVAIGKETRVDELLKQWVKAGIVAHRQKDNSIGKLF